MKWETPGGKLFTINENGSMNQALDTLTTEETILAFEGANKVMTSMLAKGSGMTVPANPTYLQLDMGIEFERRGGKVDWKSKAGLVGAEDATLKSLTIKSQKLANIKNLTPDDRLRLNLPLQNQAERANDPTSQSLRAALAQASQPNMDVMQMKALRAQIAKTLDLTVDAKPLDALDGAMFSFNRGRDGKWLAPVMAFFDDAPAQTWSRFKLADDIAEYKAGQISTLQNSRSAPLTNKLTNTVMAQPGTQVISDISGMADSQLGGTRGALSAIAGQVLTQAQRFRHNAVLTAAQGLRRLVNRETELHIDDVLKQLKPFVDQFATPAGNKSRILFNQYLSNTAGWEIKGTKLDFDGFYRLVLDDKSAANAKRLGRAVTQGEVLINPRTGKPIVLDQLANNTRKAFEDQFEALRKEANTVRAARGMGPIRKRDFYVPPTSTRGKIVGFTLDSANRVVPGGAIVADTEAEFNRLATQLRANLPNGSQFMRSEQIKRHADLWDRAGLDFIDPTSMAATRGKQTGGLSGSTIDPDSIGNAISYLKSGYEQTANGVVRTVFGSQLRIANVRAIAEATAIGRPAGTKGIWETYQEALMGIPASRDPKGINAVLQPLEKMTDTMLAAVPTAWIHNIVDMAGAGIGAGVSAVSRGKVNLSQMKTFDDLATALGPHMPFRDAVDYAEQTYKQKAPWTSKGAAQAVNRIGSAVILRWLEVPHAAMNMAGIITNMPGLLNARNVPLIGRVNGVPVIDQMKIMSRGFKRMIQEGESGWQRTSADWDHMVKNGDTSQDVAELHHQLSLIQSKSSFMKFMTGNPDGKTMLQKKGLEGMASILSDTSESLSRRWAHFVGLELADHHGITGLDARHNFARQVANDAIANYDPLNRPEMYNSAFGSMYGLFMSYAQNYYQRMFRYVEDGDYKSVGIALAAQASMFGFTGLPGARPLADLIGDTSDGDGLVPRIYERFGPATGSVIAYGGFDQLPTIFGLPSVALHTRGDVNFRAPALDMITSGQMVLPAGLEVIKDVVEGMAGVIGAMANPNVPMTSQHAAEIMARTMPNRAIRGTLSVIAAGGKESDAYGNLMADTRSVAETAYRVLGLRSGRQQAEIEAYYMNQKARAMDAQRMDAVRTATRALIRSGQMDKLPQVFHDYVDAGGKPWNYASWIRGMIGEADNTRTANQLQKALRSPGQEGLARRIELLTAPY